MSSPADEQPPRNRLSIAHLMLWTLGSAITLAVRRVLGQSAPPTFAQEAIAVGYALLSGAQIGGLLLAVWRRSLGISGFPTQPGHWLLVVGGTSVLLVALGFGLGLLVEEHVFAVLLVPPIVVTLLFLGCLRNQPEIRLPWKMVFLGFAVQYAVLAMLFAAAAWSIPLGDMFELLNLLHSWWLPAIMAIALPTAAAIDPGRSTRDILHWTGIAALAGTQWLEIAPL